MESFGRYRIVAEVSRGGMGAVFRAQAPDGRPVALKLLHAGREATALQRRRFATEAKFAGDRALLRPRVESSRSFQLLRMHSLGEGADAVDEFLYRQSHASGETFWTMRFAEGLLVSLNWEDE